MKKTITLQYTVPCSLNKIFPYFSDFKEFGRLHPYMINVNELESGEKDLNIKRFHVQEKVILFSFIPMKPAYDVEVMEVESFSKVRYTSKINIAMSLEMDILFKEDPASGTVQVTEHIELNGFPLITQIFTHILIKSHKELMERLCAEVSVKTSRS